MARDLELLPGREGQHDLLLCPEVGLFTRALPAGALLGAHAAAGVLHSLGRHFALVTPAGTAGRVVNAPPEHVLEPVGYGTVLYRLEPLASVAGVRVPASAPAAGTGALLVRSSYSGRFWQRPAPNEPPFVRVGDTLAEGQTLGLIEVMKTFTQLVYRATGGLPVRARVLRFVVAEGAEVEDGAALIEVAAL